ncbi:hypothetical protein M9Y10_007617 [Tritrichomonas musculus]|uniref:Uncharacterized protein n=1 Tax=Tritrichomonas musculus TaxID=1915356 RepID=A0ABR2J1V0_9EUKA
MSKDDLPTLKILIIGEGGVGKSCLLLRYTDDKFTEAFMPTIGVDFKTKCINIEGATVKLQVWDTAGQEKFRSITKAYFRGAHGILVVFDLSNRDSFDKTQDWINSIKESDDSIDLIIIGNKCDLQREVSIEEAQDFAAGYNVRYFETSAKDNTNVNEAFQYLSTQIYHKLYSENPIKPSTKTSKKTIKIDKADDQKNTKKCDC